jgi:hypothetical protein
MTLAIVDARIVPRSHPDMTGVIWVEIRDIFWFCFSFQDLRRNSCLVSGHDLQAAGILFQSPEGTAERLSYCVQPSLTGLDPLDSVNPGLTSWAKFSRPFGTLQDFFRSCLVVP